MIKETKVRRWEFEEFSGGFELSKTGWVHMVTPNGSYAVIHRSQIQDMADTLKEIEDVYISDS